MDVAHNKVYLKLVPRIDYTRMRGALRAPVSCDFDLLYIVNQFSPYILCFCNMLLYLKDEPRFVKMKRRPQARLFDVERIK